MEIEKITSTVLDSLLQDLNAGGITDTRPTSVPVDKDTDENVSKDPTISGNRPTTCHHQNDLRKQSRSSTSHKGASQRHSSYQIEENTKKSQEKLQDNNVSFAQEKEAYEKMINNSHCLCQHDNSNNNNNQIDQLNISFASASSCNNDNFGNRMKEVNSYKNTPRNSLYSSKKCNSHVSDEHTAMELHRSKSYIVNLIDRALSRELGTIPEDRNTKQVHPHQ